jgi:Kef-type K+ transport system membrane component KefB
MPQGLIILIFQIGIILAAARTTGWLFRKFQQPRVVGEMVAGLLLGPSFLGLVAPGISMQLFPPASLGLLNALSQLGLLLFMFLIGLELALKRLYTLVRIDVITSLVTIIFPFVLGILIALFLYPRLSPSNVRFSAFALFMGAAMSITAFPVLARILTERKLLSTEVGTVAIACAAVDDVIAWCILAGIIALVRSGGISFSAFDAWRAGVLSRHHGLRRQTVVMQDRTLLPSRRAESRPARRNHSLASGFELYDRMARRACALWGFLCGRDLAEAERFRPRPFRAI